MAHRLGVIKGVVVRPLMRIVDDRDQPIEVFGSDWPEPERPIQTSDNGFVESVTPML